MSARKTYGETYFRCGRCGIESWHPRRCTNCGYRPGRPGNGASETNAKSAVQVAPNGVVDRKVVSASIEP